MVMLTRVLLVEFDEYRCGSRDDLRHGGKRSVSGRRHDGKRSSVPAERSLIDRRRWRTLSKVRSSRVTTPLVAATVGKARARSVAVVRMAEKALG